MTLRVKRSLLLHASDAALLIHDPEGEPLHGVANGHGAYEAFDVCTVRVCGQQQRGAKATCGYDRCRTTNTVSVNTFTHGIGDDDERAERFAARKFEALGWKIGKTAKGNLCPACFARVKMASAKKKEDIVGSSSEKIVPMTPKPAVEEPKPPIEPHRAMTRDDGRIIFNKIDENYAGESVGYAVGWSDERIAKDLGVPRAWVSEIRDKYFGPDLDERQTQMLAEAKAVHLAMLEVAAKAEPIVTLLKEVLARSDALGRFIKSKEHLK
jgi:hypothetical protein